MQLRELAFRFRGTLPAALGLTLLLVAGPAQAEPASQAPIQTVAAAADTADAVFASIVSGRDTAVSCLDCDSNQGYCSAPGGTVCMNYCRKLGLLPGMCLPACNCCICPEEP